MIRKWVTGVSQALIGAWGPVYLIATALLMACAATLSGVWATVLMGTAKIAPASVVALVIFGIVYVLPWYGASFFLRRHAFNNPSTRARRIFIGAVVGSGVGFFSVLFLFSWDIAEMPERFMMLLSVPYALTVLYGPAIIGAIIGAAFLSWVLPADA